VLLSGIAERQEVLRVEGFGGFLCRSVLTIVQDPGGKADKSSVTVSSEALNASSGDE